MGWVSSEIVSIIYYLLPGFVAAWVFYGLTAHPKASPFERVVQALIFTVIVQSITIVVQWVFCAVGQLGHIGLWTSMCAFIWSVILAFVVGLVFAWLANHDYPHYWLRKLGVTTRTSFPSEWFSSFSREKRWVVLHLVGGRRLYGWPEEWPDQPDSGHFLIDQPEWLLDDGQRVPVYRAEKTLVPAIDVEMVEFVKAKEEVVAEPPQLKEANDMLTQLRKKEE